eukprot:COSAG06_NODE_60607_length_270_cov_0.736842_1_plen_76_part_10
MEEEPRVRGWRRSSCSRRTGRGGDRFGSSVALSGDVALIGADQDDNAGGSQAGAVYVFTWEAGGGDGGGGGAPGAW